MNVNDPDRYILLDHEDIEMIKTTVRTMIIQNRECTSFKFEKMLDIYVDLEMISALDAEMYKLAEYINNNTL